MTQRITPQTNGVFIIAATPFSDEGEVDYASIDSLTDFYLSFGIGGLTILGIMGEAQKLSADESLAGMRRFLARVNERIPVIVGVSAPAFDPMVSLARASMQAGAAGVMIAPPATVKTDEQFFNFFAGACRALGPEVPVCLQDYPAVTGAWMSVPVFEKIVRELPQVVMLKAEDCPGLTKISRIRALEAKGLRRSSILVGNNGLFYPLELARGADGPMTGVAYPEMLTEVYRAMRAGNRDLADDIFEIYLPLVRYETQAGVSLAWRKEILRRRGAIRSAKVRSPGVQLSADEHDDLTRMMARIESKLSALKRG
ncbi:MAG: dihydrodipicolinate synthase family protein [Betaproteobacteria bacterium]|nr:dihydrodipicolinate synthase family protein [Betaproteobacteria bacterium]